MSTAHFHCKFATPLRSTTASKAQKVTNCPSLPVTTEAASKTLHPVLGLNVQEQCGEIQ